MTHPSLLAAVAVATMAFAGAAPAATYSFATQVGTTSVSGFFEIDDAIGIHPDVLQVLRDHPGQRRVGLDQRLVQRAVTRVDDREPLAPGRTKVP